MNTQELCDAVLNNSFNATAERLQVINPIYSIYGFYAAVMASMSALWLLFDVMGI